jgi:hypothetical protein
MGGGAILMLFKSDHFSARIVDLIHGMGLEPERLLFTPTAMGRHGCPAREAQLSPNRQFAL